MPPCFLHAGRAAGLWTAPRGSNLLDSGCPLYDTYQTADGKYIAVAALEESFYQNLVRVLQLDVSHLPAHLDSKGWDELRRLLTAKFATKTRDQWTRAFEGVDACVTAVQTLDEYAKHPHTLARRAMRTTLTRTGTVQVPAPAPQLDAVPHNLAGVEAEASRDAAVGEHTLDILRELGVSEAVVAQLVQHRVVATARP